ncbi:hypothetical protein KQI84_19120 [bacterium]|nr:hypothetical protein [bacterium]
MTDFLGRVCKQEEILLALDRLCPSSRLILQLRKGLNDPIVGDLVARR